MFNQISGWHALAKLTVQLIIISGIKFLEVLFVLDKEKSWEHQEKNDTLPIGEKQPKWQISQPKPLRQKKKKIFFMY